MDKATEEKNPTTYDKLSSLINSSPEWAVGALMHLYQFQTADEQRERRTNHLNDCGFNAFDAGTLSSIAQFYQQRGYLTDRQIAFIRPALKKYINQLLLVGVIPLPIKPYTPKPKQDSFMEASLKDKNSKPVAISARFYFPKGDSRFGQTVSNVKSLPDHHWIPEEKQWHIGLSLQSAKKLKEWGFSFSPPLQAWLDDLTKPADVLNLEGLDPRLFPFQKEGIAFIESRKGRALIADHMGLGKTIQACTWLCLHPELVPVVVVCPATIKINWMREMLKWIPAAKGRVQILSGRAGNGNPTSIWGDFIIVNYDILSNQTDAEGKTIPDSGWCDILLKKEIKVLILDESQYTRSSKALRTKATKKLSKNIAHVIALSGTPIVNRPMEFFNTINMIRPDIFPSFWAFAQRFCGATYNGFGWDFRGATHTDELHTLLIETIMLRRKKEDVLKDLPDKTYSILPFEIENRREYDRAAMNIIAWIEMNEGKEKADRASQAEALVEFEKLKQLAVQGKIEAVKQWITDFLESGEKLVVYATHTRTLDILQKVFPMSVRLDGSTTLKARQEAVDLFQEHNEVKLFLGNIKAAGIGITLTASSNVAFVELPWTPGEYEQAIDRLHRIGQKNAVNVWTLVSADTVEEDVAVILSEKQKVLAAVLDGKQIDNTSVLSALIQKAKERARS